MTSSQHHFNQHQSQTNNHNNYPEFNHQQQRRESLVKPTWHNVIPGQVPPATLEKLNKLGSEDDNLTSNNDILNSSTSGKLTSGISNNQINTNKLVGNQRRQVELFDIFGKVILMFLYIHIHYIIHIIIII